MDGGYHRLKKKVFPLIGALGLLAGLALPAGAQLHTYTVDKAHSSVSFEVRHFFTPVPGRFASFDGRVAYDPSRPEQSSVYLVVQAGSIDTGVPARDQHLKSADFFAVDDFPQITFRSQSVSRVDDQTLELTGDLTLRGTTRQITLPVQVLGMMAIDETTFKAGFSAQFEIDRKDFGVSWNRKLDQGGYILGDTVTLRIVLQMDRNDGAEAPAGETSTDPSTEAADES